MDRQASGKLSVNVLVVSVTAARRDLSRLLRAVEAGYEVVITKRGRPVARLIAWAEPE